MWWDSPSFKAVWWTFLLSPNATSFAAAERDCLDPVRDAADARPPVVPAWLSAAPSILFSREASMQKSLG